MSLPNDLNTVSFRLLRTIAYVGKTIDGLGPGESIWDALVRQGAGIIVTWWGR